VSNRPIPFAPMDKPEEPNSRLIVAVSGGRDYADAAKVDSVLGKLHKERGIELIIEGACPVGHGGADELSRKWAKKNEVNSLSVPAKSKLFGWPSCGPQRNQEVARLKPDVWVLFPGGRGTASAKECATQCGAEVIEVSYDD
jgi:hypothetical protein